MGKFMSDFRPFPYIDPFLQGLPFKYFVDRDLQMQEEETGCPEKDEWESKPLMVRCLYTKDITSS